MSLCDCYAFRDSSVARGQANSSPCAMLLRVSRKRETGMIVSFEALLVPTRSLSHIVAQSPSNTKNTATSCSFSLPALETDPASHLVTAGMSRIMCA